MDYLKSSLCIILYFFCGVLLAQQQVTIDDAVSPQDLVENTLIQGCVEVSNISSPSNGNVIGLSSFGYFERGSSNFPFQNGIILTTGNAASAGNSENTAVLNEGNANWLTDVDLENTLGISGTLNATSIEFDFISISNQIQFNYILASEEYFANFPCEYSDGFALLIREAGTNAPYTNIAVVPGTATPVNTTTVHDEIPGFCAASNPEFFEGYNLGDTNYNGRTTVLSATAAIQPNVQYQIKLIIADQNDENYDSAVFIEGSSFNATVDLGEDFSTCASEVSLDGNINNTSATYSWFFNGAEVPNATDAFFEVTQSGNYRVTVEIPLANGVCTIEDDINIELSSTQTSVPISDYLLCDDSGNDETELFDLSTKDAEVLASVPPSNYNISYHSSLSEAQNDTAAITAPFQNTFNPQIVHVRIEDITNGCLAFSTINLIVNPLPLISDPTPLDVCDDQDADGITEIDLTAKNDEITNGQSNLIVTYHSTPGEAAIGSNPLPMPYVNTGINEQVYVSVQNSQTGCITTTVLVISVSDIPIIDRGNHYIDACDSDYDGFAQFDLTSITTDVLDGLSGVSVTFHEIIEDALSGSNPIANPTSYDNITANEQIIFIRVFNDTTGCAAVTPIELHTNLLLTATNLSDYSICDIDNDGVEEFSFAAIATTIVHDIPDIIVVFYETEADRDNQVNPLDPAVPYITLSNPQTIYLGLSSPTCTDVADIELVINPIIEFDSIGSASVCDEDQDGFTTMDLSQFDELVVNGQSGFSVSYFLNEADALSNTDPLPNFYTNSSNPFTVFPRIQFDATGCADVNSFDLNVLPAPVSTTPQEIVICDADRDGISNIDLSAIIPEIVTSTVNRTISFHNSLDEADQNQSAITETQNYPVQTEIVFIRIENTTTGCHSVEELNVVVNTLPFVGTVSNEMTDYNICENESDGVGEFIFETKDAEALNGQTGKVVSYYLNQSDADNKSNALNKSSAYENTSNPQTIFLRVENITDETCYMTSSFNIAVGTNPEFHAPSDWFVCDDMSNNGSEVFDLSTRIEEISAGFPNIQNVTFYTSEINAISGDNPLPLEFENTVNPQQIYVQIDNGTICNSITSFILNVIQVPEVSPGVPIIVCDDNNDGSVTVDLTLAENTILDVRPDDLEISYFENLEDADLEVNQILDPENYTNSTNPQTVYIKVTNTISNCYVTLPIEIIANSPPLINDFMVYDICTNPSNAVDLTEINAIAVNDTTDVIFTYFRTEADAIANSNPLDTNYTYQSNFDTLFLRAENGITNCTIVYEFNISVNSAPVVNQPNDLEACDDDFDGIFEFDLTQQNGSILGNQNPALFSISYHNSLLEAETNTAALDSNYFAFDTEIIVVRIEDNNTGCFSTTQFSIVIHPLPIIDIGDQVICLNNLPLIVSANTNNATDQYQWSTGAISPEIEITEIGDYWVRITTEFGCQNIETFNVSESEAATIEATEIIDFSDPNNITITISGIGDYLYQLDDGEPQASNFFANVSMGYHTITIIDLNGCAEVTKEVLVMDIPKFMTPNDDGAFDTWHIVGIEQLPGTVIQIFNRYGKLLTVLTSNTAGWDGMYNGTRMPASDYWFVANIKRGNNTFQVKGHFTLRR